MIIDDTIMTLAKSYIVIHRDFAFSTIAVDINRAIGLRDWNKAHVLYRIQKRMRKLEVLTALKTSESSERL
jgi:hypothetical protein